VLRGDAADLPLPDGSVDLIVTSPPFWSLRAYVDNGRVYEGQIGAEPTPGEYIANLVRCTREWTRVLKPKGSIFVNLGDKYNAYNGNRGDGRIQKNAPRQRVESGHGLDVKAAPNKSLLLLPERYRIACLDELGLIVRSVTVWDKSNGMPESVKDRVRRSHEDWVHLTLDPRYYADVRGLREPHSPAGIARAKHRRLSPDLSQEGVGNPRTFNPKQSLHPDGKLPGSVWRIPTQAFRPPAHIKIRHTATFPLEWPRRLIEGWCPPGGTVLDPFGGSGTTALMAKVMGRHGISVDLSGTYCDLASWRIADPKEVNRAERVARGARGGR
jgi:site-specific DNA-methyltransferase (cytosine-N4-specific)